MERKNGMLYPMMIIAAIAVTLFSIVGIATMTGHMPSAFSQKSDAQKAEAQKADAQKADAQKGEDQKTDAGKPSSEGSRSAPARPSRSEAATSCGNCGVIESIRIVEAKGQGSGVGAAIGGVTGGLLGNQVGRGGGRTAATILGAAGGAYVGNEIEKSTKKATYYRITVRMEDGTYRTITQRNHPGYTVGDKVKLVNGAIVSRG